MPRLARVVLSGMPHHVIQRGNRRQQTFFADADYQTYLTLFHRFCRSYEVEIWCYTLMPNHVHHVLVPPSKEALTRAVARTHQAYSGILNHRQGWRGHFWQGRYKSFPMDEHYLLNVARYILLNPVRAGIARRVDDWPWSSWKAHLGHEDDIVTADGLGSRVSDWRSFLDEGLSAEDLEALRLHERTGRPLGDDAFLLEAERVTGRVLRAQKPGPPARMRVISGGEQMAGVGR